MANRITEPAEKKAALLMLCGFKTKSQCGNTDALDVAGIINKVAEAFESRQNPQLIRHKLSNAKQEPSEPIGDFVDRLRALAVPGKVADTEAAVMDALAGKCRSLELKKFILSKPDATTLTDIIRYGAMIEQFETPPPSLDVLAVQPHSAQAKPCGNCGRFHPPRSCPAFGKTCYKCRRENHLSKMCRQLPQTDSYPGAHHPPQYGQFTPQPRHSQPNRYDPRSAPNPSQAPPYPQRGRTPYPRQPTGQYLPPVYSTQPAPPDFYHQPFSNSLNHSGPSTFHVSSDQKETFVDDYEYYNDQQGYLYCVNSVHPAIQAKFVLVQIEDLAIYALPDTGSDHTIVQLTDFNAMNPKPALQPSTLTLFGFNNNVPISLIGQFWAKLSARGRVIHELVHVTDHPNVNFFSDVPGLIKGIQIKLHVDTSIPAVHEKHRRVPLHLRPEVEAELYRMNDITHIERDPTNEPTTWVSNITCVRKPDGTLRVCTANRQPNRAILRERHPMANGSTLTKLLLPLSHTLMF